MAPPTQVQATLSVCASESAACARVGFPRRREVCGAGWRDGPFGFGHGFLQSLDGGAAVGFVVIANPVDVVVAGAGFAEGAQVTLAGAFEKGFKELRGDFHRGNILPPFPFSTGRCSAGELRDNGGCIGRPGESRRIGDQRDVTIACPWRCDAAGPVNARRELREGCFGW
jgi:hypothetical protein